MDRIAVAGLSIHEASAHELELVGRGPHSADENALRELADELAGSELVLLRTCNRVELVLARESGAPPAPREREAVAQALGLEPGPLRERLHFHCGRPAIRHLFRVACSLDSLVLGEDQILAQVKAAWSAARDQGLTGSLLDPVFEAAIQVGKRVRTETDLCRHPISVVALGVQALRERAPPAGPGRIALLGAGRTARLAGHTLLAEGWPVAFVVHRTTAGAAALAAELGAQPLDLESFRSGAQPVDALIAATSAPGIVLDGAALRRLARETSNGPRLLAIDLALPRDLEAPGHPGIQIVDLEALKALAAANRDRRALAAQRAELLVDAKLEALDRRMARRRTEVFLSEVLAETSERLEHELRALSSGHLARLEARDREAVERWARSTFGRLAHAPVQAAKRLASQNPELVDEDEEETTG